MPVWLANCCFAHDSLEFSVLLRFCDAQPAHSSHPPLYVDRCLIGADRDCGIRAIVGPKNEADDVEVATVNACESVMRVHRVDV